jgi:hypothetical protein
VHTEVEVDVTVKHTGIDKQLGNFSDAAQILFSVFSAEPKVFAEAVAHIVAIKDKGVDLVMKQPVLKFCSDGGLARG